jgi:hypothetical protein
MDKNAKQVALLCLFDTLERIDIFLHEARHIQINIIHSLRAPNLYQSLRFEERTLWKDWSSEIFNDFLSGVIHTASSAARHSTIDYPRPLKAFQETDTNGGNSEHSEDSREKDERQYVLEGNKIRADFKEYVQQVWGGGLWTNEQQRYYHTLSSIQRIKRNVVKDRIILCEEARNCFHPAGENNKDYKAKARRLGRLLCIRSAVNDRLNEAIARLGDCQGQFSKSQDMALNLDTPRPCLERRREQRLYTSHMSDQCRDLWKEYCFFWKEYVGGGKAPKMPIIQHCWQHNVTSEWRSHVNMTVKEDNDYFGPSINMHFINSSYFMPDKPDLLGLIGHEAAHAFLDEAMDGLTPQRLSTDNTSFSKLLRLMVQILDNYKFEDEGRYPALPLAKEIAVDLITASTQGASYLYALTIEMMGFDLSSLFRYGNTPVVDLDLREHIKGAGGDYDQSREWYLRLQILCSLIEEIAYTLPEKSAGSELSLRLVNGVRNASDSLLVYLDDIAAPKLKSSWYWKGVSKRLVKLLRTSEYVSDVSRFWRERENDYYGKTKFFATSGSERQTPPQKWPLHLAPLPKAARKFLHFWAESQFKDSNLFINTSDAAQKMQSGSLFENLQDISWQSAMLFADQLVEDHLEFKKLLNQKGVYHFAEKMAKLRSAYFYGLEFENAKLESPSICLENILCAFRKTIIPDCKERGDVISRWREAAKTIVERNITGKRIGRHEFDHRETIIEKLCELKELMGSASESHPDLWLPIQSYLNIFLNGSHLDVEAYVARSFYREEGLNNINHPFLLGRITMGAMHRLIDDATEDGLKDYYRKNHRRSSSASQAVWDAETNHYFSTPLLGRYDKLVAMPFDGDLYKMPKFEKSPSEEMKNERFLPYFARWEIGLPVRLGSEWSKVKQEQRTNGPLAFLSVSLTSSSSRLLFLARLLETVNQDQRNNATKHLENLTAHFQPHDQAFLTDGWEDLVLVFYGDSDRVGDIFDIQRVIYNDFMVTRTELVFSARALESIKSSKDYVIRVAYREVDESKLNWVKTQSQVSQNWDFPLMVQKCHTPGRLDGMLYITKNNTSTSYPDAIYSIILTALKECKVDRVQTDLCQLVAN